MKVLTRKKEKKQMRELMQDVLWGLKNDGPLLGAKLAFPVAAVVWGLYALGVF